jgi:hypothetical protein
LKFRVHYHLYAAGGRLWPTWSEVEADDAIHAVDVAELRQRASDRERGRAYVGFFQHVGVEELESVNPATVPEKGEPMEASGSTTTTTTTNGAAAETEQQKEDRKPTERQVFQQLVDEDGKPVIGPNGGTVWEKIGKPCTGSRRESIGDAMDELKVTAGTFMAPPTRSIQTETPGTESVTKRVW